VSNPQDYNSGDMPPPAAQDSLVIKIIMFCLGVLLLLPGICVVVFAGAMPGSVDGQIVILWLVCLAISAGGVFLIAKSFARL